MTDIPLNEDEVINEVTVTRRNKRIHVTSKPVCVPLPATRQCTDTVSSPPERERDGDMYSDTEGIELLPETRSRERKGPSRSVSVCLLFRTIHAFFSILIAP